MSRWARRLLVGQGLFYVATGVWPLVSIRSFEFVTGPKVDDWLVQTVGVLVIAIGATLLYGARRDRPVPESFVLAGGTALGFALVDAYFVLVGRISPIYLADAAVECMFCGAAVWFWARRDASA